MGKEQKLEMRAFQREVRDAVRAGKNILLQAPTGAGKTNAALWPYIQCLEQDGDWLPRTCIYAAPMRVLTNQFYEQYQGRMQAIDRTRGRRLTEVYEKLKREPVSIQTGELPGDPQFESLITFCTIDQVLASFLAVPYGVSARYANINVGAVIGSYLVLDEFHLYPLLKEGEDVLGARTTVLTLLRLLSKVTRFILMTATFSTALIEELATLLDAEVVTVSDVQELNKIAAGRRRYFAVSDEPMSADAILQQHQHCSLVICNTVLRAQQRYWELKEEAQRRGIGLVLLHSRLTDEDRSARSSRITRELGQAPDAWDGEERYGWKDGRYYGKNMIVVATQVVEVGLDISVETLHTELAPANSLIQRAGRCARFAQQQGDVLVYEPGEDGQGRPVSARPYNQAICDQTLTALRTLDPQQPIGFKEERALLDAVHTEEDTDLLARYKKQDRIEKDIFASFNTNQRGIVSTLIRDVAQVQILIHDDPDAVITEEPWRWQSFALHPGSLAGSWSALEARADEHDLDWICRIATLEPGSEGADPDNTQPARYTWKPLASSGNVSALQRSLSEALMIVLPTQLATYHDDLGFVLLDGRLPVESTGYQSTPPRAEGQQATGEQGTKRKKPAYSPIRMESYQQHINGLVHAYSYGDGGIRANIRYIAARLEEQMGLPQGSIDHAIRLALACHDLGKLSVAWQQWAWQWTQRLHESEQRPASLLPAPGFFFAKTEFDYSQKQRALQRAMKTRRPHHACESAMLGLNLLADSLGVRDPDDALAPLLYATCAAIARHHTPQAHECEATVLAQGAQEAVREALEAARQELPWHYTLTQLERGKIERCNLAPNPEEAVITTPRQGRQQELETWLYFVIVRALRLTDQRAGIRW